MNDAAARFEDRLAALVHAFGLARSVPIRRWGQCGFELPQLRSLRRNHGVEFSPLCGGRAFSIVRREAWPAETA